MIVPVTGTPFTVSALPARSPKFRTVKARVVFAAVACTSRAGGRSINGRSYSPRTGRGIDGGERIIRGLGGT